jgi:A1 cistron-splicing factor AAR2
MNQEDANKLIHVTATILCLDVPKGTEFGIDNHSYIVGDKFKGVKLIPPGVHFVYYSASERHGGASAPRTSFFVNLKSQQVIVRRWNTEHEDFDDESTMSEQEVEAYIQGVRNMDFDKYLGAYSYDTFKKWQELISFITPKVLEKLEPVGHKIDSTSKPMTKEEEEKYRKEFNLPAHENNPVDQQLKNLTNIVPVHQPYYSAIPTKKLPNNNQNIDPRLITMYNMDKSLVLEELIEKEYNGDPNMILGELQFTFVAFLMGQSFESFEAWKNLISVLCQCDDALNKYSELFINFTNVFLGQLIDVPEDFFIDEISGGGKNFVREMLKAYFELTDDENIDIKLRSEVAKLKKFVDRKFKQSFSIAEFEDDEDAPTIVEVPDMQSLTLS